MRWKPAINCGSAEVPGMFQVLRLCGIDVPLWRPCLRCLRDFSCSTSVCYRRSGIDVSARQDDVLAGHIGVFMVIIAAFIGTQDLGQEKQRALSSTDVGKGLVLGFAGASMGPMADHLLLKWSRSGMIPSGRTTGATPN
jgi:hypothetical protein